MHGNEQKDMQRISGLLQCGYNLNHVNLPSLSRYTRAEQLQGSLLCTHSLGVENLVIVIKAVSFFMIRDPYSSNNPPGPR